MRKIIIIFCLSYACVFFTSKIYAQNENLKIQGQILNSSTFQPISGVEVKVNKEQSFDTEDDLGMPGYHSKSLSLAEAKSNENGIFELLVEYFEGGNNLKIVFLRDGFEDFQEYIMYRGEDTVIDFMVLLNPVRDVVAEISNELRGVVNSAETFGAVSGARIKVENYPDVDLFAPIYAFSMANGSFVVPNIPGHKILVSVEHKDFDSFNEILDLSSGLVSDIMVLLKKRDVVHLPEVVIADRPVERTPYIANVILSESFENQAVSDVGTFLRTVPNVGGIRRGGANIDPVIRGFKYSQINVLINGAQGVEGGCPNRMDPATSRIEAEDLERIEVYKGPYALRFGAALGGTVNLVTKRPELTESPSVSVKGLRGYESNWNGHKEHLTVKGSNKNAYFQLSGSRWEYGNYQDGNGNIVKSAFNKHNYGGLAGVKHDRHELMFSMKKSAHKVLFPALPMDETDDIALLTFAEYQYKPENKILKEVSVKAYHSDIHHIMDNKNRPFSDTVAAVSDVKALTNGLKLESQLNAFKGFMHVGFDYQSREKSGTRTRNFIMQPMLPVRVENLWNEAVINNYGAYVEYMKGWNKFDFVLAARYDINEAESGVISQNNMAGNSLLNLDDTQSSFNNVSFSGGITRHIGKSSSLSLSGGRVTRSPDMLERFIILLPVGFDPYDYLGNPQLEPEINNQADLTFRHQNDVYGSFELNAFYSVVENFIYGKMLSPVEQMQATVGVLGVKQFHNGDVVHIKGFEFSYKTPDAYDFQAGLTAAFAQATIAEVTKHIRENNQITGTVQIQDDPLNEIPPFEGNAFIAYRLFNNKAVPKLSIRYVADQNRVSDAMYESNTPGFVLFNAGLTYKHNDFLNVNAGVNNILDKAYYEHLNRRLVGSTNNIFEPGRVYFINLIFNI